MREELVPVTRTREVKPEGADSDAAAFRAVANRCRRLGDDIRGLQTELDQVWQGRSRERFFHDHSFVASSVEMEKLAEWLETQAVRIDQRMVTIEYTVLIPIHRGWY